MLTKRNSIGHLVNASTRLGERLVGTSKVVTTESYVEGVTASRDPALERPMGV
jgi:hypothetical protein